MRVWAAVVVVLAAGLVSAETDRERQAREDVERQLKLMVGTPPTKIKITFGGLEQPQYKVREAKFLLDGKSLPVGNVDKLSEDKEHLIFHGDVAPGAHRVEAQVVVEDTASPMISNDSGYKWTLLKEVTFSNQAGIEVAVDLETKLNPSAKDRKARFTVTQTATPKMLAKLDDGSMPPLPPKPNIQVAAVADAGTPKTAAELAAEEKAAKKAAAEEAKRLAAEEKKRKADEAKAAALAAAEAKKQKAEEAKAAALAKKQAAEEARLAAAEEKKRKAEEAKAAALAKKQEAEDARLAALAEKQRQADEAKLTAAEKAARAEAEKLPQPSASATAANTLAQTDNNQQPQVAGAVAEATADAGTAEADAGVVAEAVVDAGAPVAVAEAPKPVVKPAEPSAPPADEGLPIIPIAIGVGVLIGIIVLVTRRKK